MAKAVEISTEIAEAHPQQWFAEAMRVRFDEVLRFVDAAIKPDNIKGIHDIRVAIRRLRSLIRDFAGIAKSRSLPRFAKELKTLAQRLGRVRDSDVLIRGIEQASKGAPNEMHEGLTALVSQFRHRRSRDLRSVVTSLSEEAIEELRKQMEAVCRAVVRQPGLFDSPNVRREAHRTIGANLEDFLSKSGAIYRPTAAKGLHRLRIAAKRLRYSLEVHSAQFDGRLDKFATEMKKMQGLLGDLHDCDVWIDELRSHLERKPAKGAAEARTAAVWLIAQFAKQRNKAYLAALQLWTAWQEDDLFGNLNRTIKENSK